MISLLYSVHIGKRTQRVICSIATSLYGTTTCTMYALCTITSGTVFLVKCCRYVESFLYPAGFKDVCSESVERTLICAWVLIKNVIITDGVMTLENIWMYITSSMLGSAKYSELQVLIYCIIKKNS